MADHARPTFVSTRSGTFSAKWLGREVRSFAVRVNPAGFTEMVACDADGTETVVAYFSSVAGSAQCLLAGEFGRAVGEACGTGADPSRVCTISRTSGTDSPMFCVSYV